MNKIITGNDTQTLTPTPVKEENVELIRKVKATTPPVRAELVAEMKAKIKTGEYDVSSETVAQDIIAHLSQKPE